VKREDLIRVSLVHDYSPAEFHNNVIGLARTGKVHKLPTVLTTSMADGPNGPIIPEVMSLFPDAPGDSSTWTHQRVG
jgi:hypothetical protein